MPACCDPANSRETSAQDQAGSYGCIVWFVHLTDGSHHIGCNGEHNRTLALGERRGFQAGLRADGQRRCGTIERRAAFEAMRVVDAAASASPWFLIVTTSRPWASRWQ